MARCTVVTDMSGKPADVDMATANDTRTVQPGCHVTARTAAFGAEMETNGKCQEQLEMMIIKDNVPRVCDSKDFSEVLSLGCNCRQRSTLKGNVVMVVMLLSNMLNYMDRFTIVGMLRYVYLELSLSACHLREQYQSSIHINS